MLFKYRREQFLFLILVKGKEKKKYYGFIIANLNLLNIIKCELVDFLRVGVY